MNNKNNGGSAFPIQSLRQLGQQNVDNDFDFAEIGQKGMSLRDYFAAKAMQGMMSKEYNFDYENQKELAEDYAERGYIMADAMLEAREK